MRPLILFVLLGGCAHVYRSPSGPDTAEVDYTTLIARSPLDHQTAVHVKSGGSEEWKEVERRKSFRVHPGVNHFRFAGVWLAEPAHDHHHHYYGCGFHPHHSIGGGGVGAAFAAIGLALTIATVAEEAEAHRKQPVDACVAELSIEVEAEDDIDLAFRHDDQGRCDVVCSSFTDYGKRPCRIVETVASR